MSPDALFVGAGRIVAELTEIERGSATLRGRRLLDLHAGEAMLRPIVRLPLVADQRERCRCVLVGTGSGIVKKGAA